MLDMLFATISATGIGLVFKLSENRVQNRITLLLGNYLFATFASIAFFLTSDASFSLSPVGAGLAVFGGLNFAFNFFLMMLAIKKRGMALPVILMRLSAIVPIMAGLLVFAETPSWLQVIGLVIALLAAVILSLNLQGGELADKAKLANERSGMLLLSSLLILFSFGLGDTTLKFFDELGDSGQKPLFLALLFFTAFLILTLVAIIKRAKPTLNDLLWGFLLGLPNQLVAYFAVSALETHPGYIVFPVVSATTVMLATLVASILFKEKLGRYGALGIGLTILAVIALN